MIFDSLDFTIERQSENAIIVKIYFLIYKQKGEPILCVYHGVWKKLFF